MAEQFKFTTALGKTIVDTIAGKLQAIDEPDYKEIKELIEPIASKECTKENAEVICKIVVTAFENQKKQAYAHTLGIVAKGLVATLSGAVILWSLIQKFS